MVYNYLIESLWPLITNAVDLGANLARWRKLWSVDADFSGVVTISRTPTAATDAANKAYVDTTGGLDVEEVDGSPSYTEINVIRFDQVDGFVITQPGAGIARVDLAAIPTSVLAGPITAAKGGTNIDSSGSTGIPLVTSGTWTIPSLVAASLGGTGIDSTGVTGVPLVTIPGTWTLEAQVSTVRGGTAIDSSGLTGVPLVSSGVWTVPPQVSAGRGGTGIDSSALTGIARIVAGTWSALTYTESTWTPVLTFGTPGDLSVVYSNQVGRYTRIGRMVFLSFRITTSTFTHTTASGACTITGAPFSAAASIEHVGPLVYQGITQASSKDIRLRIQSGSATIDLLRSESGAGITQVVVADMPTGGSVSFYGSLAYDV